MVILTRVDDRLLHGQIICAWVPFLKADALLVASDEVAGDNLVSEIISSCGYCGLNVYVNKIEDAVKYVRERTSGEEKIILITGDLSDAMKLYKEGFEFNSINLGNIHHDDENGRKISPSVIINQEDEEIIDEFLELGVKIDIRDVPTSVPAYYASRKRSKT